MFQQISEVSKLVNVLENKLKFKLLLNFILSLFIVLLEIYPLRLFLIYFENNDNQSSNLINFPLIEGFENYILATNLNFFLLIFFLISFISFFAKLFFERYSLKLYGYISNLYILNLYKKLINMELEIFEKQDFNLFLNLINISSSKLTYQFSAIQKTLFNVVSLLLFLLFGFLKFGLSNIIIFIYFTITFVFSQSFVSRKLLTLNKSILRLESEMLKSTRNSLKNKASINVRSIENLFLKNTYLISLKLRLKQSLSQFYVSLPKNITNLLFYFSLGFTIFLMKNSQTSTISIPLMSFIVVYLQRLLTAFNNIFNGYNSLISFYHHIKEYNKNVTLISDFSPEIINSTKENFSNIEICNIEYSFSDNNKVLSDLSLQLKFNQNLLIKGNSGSGKTTLMKIIIGFYKPQKGFIRINEKFENIPLFSKVHCELVSQIPLIYDSTILQFLLNNTHLEGEVSIKNFPLLENILDKLNLLKPIHKLKHGFDTFLSIDQDFLSGGQTQRLDIARSMFSNASLIFLDEPTSAQDKYHIDLISELLFDSELSKTKSIIAISHSKRFCSNFDNVINL